MRHVLSRVHRLSRIAVCAASAALACQGSSTPAPSAPDQTPPTAVASPPAGMMLLARTPVVLQFSMSMNPASLALSGDLAPEVKSVQWFQPSGGPYTVMLSPSSPWAAGEARTLTIEVSSAAGSPLESMVLRYDVARGTLLYVSSAAGDDSRDGLTPATAKKNVHAAVTAASPPASVIVAEGDYPPPGSYPVTLPGDVSLYGGFTGDFLSRDPAAHPSRILGTGVRNGTALSATAAMTDTTVVDGLVFEADSTVTNSIAADIAGAAAPLLQRNAFIARNGAGSAGAFSVALSVASSATVRGNSLRGGRAYFSGGIRVTAGSPLVANNVIDGGNGTTFAFGILVNGGAPVIVNNTVGGGAGDGYTFGISTSSAASVIENNVVFTTAGAFGRACIEHDGGTAPASVRNNDLFDCPAALYVETVGGLSGTCAFNKSQDCHTVLVEVNDATVIGVGKAGGNVSSEPVFVDPGARDYHLTGASPASVANGGLDRSDLIGLDRDGRPRTLPWSIGAYERD